MLFIQFVEFSGLRKGYLFITILFTFSRLRYIYSRITRAFSPFNVSFFIVIHFSCIFFFIVMFFLFFFSPYYSYTQTFSLSLLYCCYSYCVSFYAILDGVGLSGNKRITYLLTYLLTYL